MHTISVTVRTLDGRKADLALPEGAHIQEVRSAAEAELKGSFRLLVRVSQLHGNWLLFSVQPACRNFRVYASVLQGTEFPGVETLSSLGLGPDEFLVGRTRNPMDTSVCIPLHVMQKYLTLAALQVALPVRKRKASKLAAAGVPGPPPSKPIAGGAAPSAEPAANVAAEVSTLATGAVDHQPHTAASYTCQAIGSTISHSQAAAVEQGVQALSPSAQMGSPAHVSVLRFSTPQLSYLTS